MDFHRGTFLPYGNAYNRSMETLGEMYGFSIAFSLSGEGGGELNYKSNQSEATNFPAKIL